MAVSTLCLLILIACLFTQVPPTLLVIYVEINIPRKRWLP